MEGHARAWRYKQDINNHRAIFRLHGNARCVKKSITPVWRLDEVDESYYQLPRSYCKEKTPDSAKRPKVALMPGKSGRADFSVLTDGRVQFLSDEYSRSLSLHACRALSGHTFSNSIITVRALLNSKFLISIDKAMFC